MILRIGDSNVVDVAVFATERRPKPNAPRTQDVSGEIRSVYDESFARINGSTDARDERLMAEAILRAKHDPDTGRPDVWAPPTN